jgi:uncharacterized protein (TIGR02145 family)
MKTYGSVTYEGQTYKTVVIGTQTWFQRNLNYAVAGSKCGNGGSLSDANTTTCDTYGRLYNWATAMNLPASCNSSSCATSISAKHQGICPSGWHLPSPADWNVLMKFVNPSCSDNGSCDGAGTKLRATSGWNTCSSCKTGTDDYGFSALPGGGGNSGGYFYSAGDYGYWWSASERNSISANYRYMDYDDEYVYWVYEAKYYSFSVRCLQD